MWNTYFAPSLYHVKLSGGVAVEFGLDETANVMAWAACWTHASPSSRKRRHVAQWNHSARRVHDRDVLWRWHHRIILGDNVKMAKLLLEHGGHQWPNLEDHRWEEWPHVCVACFRVAPRNKKTSPLPPAIFVVAIIDRLQGVAAIVPRAWNHRHCLSRWGCTSSLSFGRSHNDPVDSEVKAASSSMES